MFQQNEEEDEYSMAKFVTKALEGCKARVLKCGLATAHNAVEKRLNFMSGFTWNMKKLTAFFNQKDIEAVVSRLLAKEGQVRYSVTLEEKNHIDCLLCSSMERFI